MWNRIHIYMEKSTHTVWHACIHMDTYTYAYTCQLCFPTCLSLSAVFCHYIQAYHRRRSKTSLHTYMDAHVHTYVHRKVNSCVPRTLLYKHAYIHTIYSIRLNDPPTHVTYIHSCIHTYIWYLAAFTGSSPTELSSTSIHTYMHTWSSVTVTVTVILFKCP